MFLCSHILSGQGAVLRVGGCQLARALGREMWKMTEMRWNPLKESNRQDWVWHSSCPSKTTGWLCCSCPIPWSGRANPQFTRLGLVGQRILPPIYLYNPPCASGTSLGPVSSLKPYRWPEFMLSLISVIFGHLAFCIVHFCTNIVYIL